MHHLTLPRRLARRSTLAVATVVAVGASLLGTALPAQAAPKTDPRDTTATASSEETIPAPPKPDRTKPVERVVAATAGATTLAATTMATTTATIAAPSASGAGAPGAGTGKTLVLYDNTGPYSWLGEVYGIATVNLASHFGAWTAHPVGNYTAGELAGYTSVVYVGSTYDEPLPVAFLDDVTATTKPVLWIYDNIWQLTARDTTFTTTRGFTWKQFDFAAVSKVSYKNTDLTRDTVNGSGIMDYVISDPTKARVLATAQRPDGTTFPWAVRSGNFTYVGEIPYAYVTHDDRYIAFADLLFDSLSTKAVADRHRGLVRIEDVGPDADPNELKAVADYLSSQKVPFTVAVYPRYRDPLGVENIRKQDRDYTLKDRPAVVSALKYMQSKGGTLLMHGYTHQYSNVANPYDGISANDFEFYLAHIDATNSVIYDGPVSEDSTTWVNSRLTASANEFTRAGLSVPTIFEFPHYAGSALDYRAVNTRFGTRYDRELFFPGVLNGGTIDYTRPVGQFFPYTVRDVYGSAVVPENLGNVEPEPFNNHPPRLPSDILASAKRNLAIRDGVASIFYHPYLGTSYLKTLVPSLKQMGYTFVPASAMLAG